MLKQRFIVNNTSATKGLVQGSFLSQRRVEPVLMREKTLFAHGLSLPKPVVALKAGMKSGVFNPVTAHDKHLVCVLSST